MLLLPLPCCVSLGWRAWGASLGTPGLPVIINLSTRRKQRTQASGSWPALGLAPLHLWVGWALLVWLGSCRVCMLRLSWRRRHCGLLLPLLGWRMLLQSWPAVHRCLLQ